MINKLAIFENFIDTMQIQSSTNGFYRLKFTEPFFNESTQHLVLISRQYINNNNKSIIYVPFLKNDLSPLMRKGSADGVYFNTKTFNIESKIQLKAYKTAENISPKSCVNPYIKNNLVDKVLITCDNYTGWDKKFSSYKTFVEKFKISKEELEFIMKNKEVLNIYTKNNSKQYLKQIISKYESN